MRVIANNDNNQILGVDEKGYLLWDNGALMRFDVPDVKEKIVEEASTDNRPEIKGIVRPVILDKLPNTELIKKNDEKNAIPIKKVFVPYSLNNIGQVLGVIDGKNTAIWSNGEFRIINGNTGPVSFNNRGIIFNSEIIMFNGELTRLSGLFKHIDSINRFKIKGINDYGQIIVYRDKGGADDKMPVSLLLTPISNVPITITGKSIDTWTGLKSN